MLLLRRAFSLKEFKRTLRTSVRFSQLYVQGQSPEPKIREYFYYIDHQGQLFLDDSKMKNFTSCFKDKEFLEFFFTRLRTNNTGRYQDSFPFLSLCGRERNFIRCDDVPIVYTEVLKMDGTERFSYCNTGPKLSVPFSAEHLCMLPHNGRVYYPANDKLGGIGLVKSSLAIELSKVFVFDNGHENPPTHIEWNGQMVTLNNRLLTHNKLKL